MKTRNTLYLTLIIAFVFSSGLNAQFFDRLKKRTQDKLERKAEQKLVEELSEEIARRAFRPIEKAMDDMLRSSYEESEKEAGRSVDWEKAGESYAQFLGGMNQAANVPPSYDFKTKIDVAITDYDKKKSKISYLFSDNSKIMGIVSYDKGDKSMVVMDTENDAMVIYAYKDGKTTAQAIPAFTTMLGGMAAMSDEKVFDENEFKVTKTGKTKKILGYQCDEYIFEDKDTEGKGYMTNELDVDLKQFLSGFENMMPLDYKNQVNNMSGMLLQSETKMKQNKKKKMTWKTVKIDEETITFDNVALGLHKKSVE